MNDMTTNTNPADTAALTEAVKIMEPFEGFSAVPYRCPAGVWTIGYGSTRDHANHPVTAQTQPITQAIAESWALQDMRLALDTVRTDVHTPITVPEAAALADFVYNLGSGNFKVSAILRCLNAGDHAGACKHLADWNMGGGKVLAGLVRRRAAEQAEFVKKDIPA